MRSGNPALNANTFLDASSGRVVGAGDSVMTINGTVNKTAFLLILVLVTAMYTWSLYTGPESMPAIMPLILVGAMLNLVLDFDFIEAGAEAGAPKYMEWFGAFGLVVTLVWLYIEILRLLSKLQSRN